MEEEIIYKRASTLQELNEILQLQHINLPSSLSDNEKKEEGFLTIHHDLELLQAMNESCPHIIATHKNRIIGYTLCMTNIFKDSIAIAKPLFEKADELLSTDIKYMVMGQVCVDKTYRGRGVFRSLYEYMQEALKLDYDMIVTEVNVKNTRSVNAHLSIGFKILYSYRANHQDWHIIYLNLN